MDSILKQVVRHPSAYTDELAMRQVALHIMKHPEKFYPLLENELLETGESFESYCVNVFYGNVWGDDLIAAAFGDMWNLTITIVSPAFTDPIKLFHNSPNPDVVIIANGGCYRDPVKGATHFTATKSNDTSFKIAGSYLFDTGKAPDATPKLMPVHLTNRQEAKQKAIQHYLQNRKESSLEVLCGLSRNMNSLNNYIGGLMNDHDRITQSKELAEYKLEKLGVNIEKIEEAGAVQPRNWIQTEEREKLDAERAVKRKMEQEKEEKDQKQRQAKRQKTIATVGGKRRLSFENVGKENEQQDELAKELDFFAKRAEQQNEIIKNHEEMLTKADDELARKERKMQLIEEELQKKERKIKELEQGLQQKSVEGEIVEQPKIQQPVASSSSTSGSVYALENIVKPEHQRFLSKPQKSIYSTVPGTQVAMSSVSNVNPTHQQVITVPVTQEYCQMPSNVPSVVSVIQPMQTEVYIEDPDNTNVDQVILVKKNAEKVTEKRSGRTQPVTGILQDSTRKYCDSCTGFIFTK